jgi:GNAT superfamily N-acetyltransferase
MDNRSEWKLASGLTVMLARPEDVDAILTIWADANEWMRERGIEPGAPPIPMREIVADRISRGTSYIAQRNGTVAEMVGTLTLEWADDGAWSDGAANDACYVHGLATQRASARQGIGVELLHWAEEMARAAGKAYLRLDCDADNPKLCAYYRRAGLGYCGNVRTVTHHAALFQKKISG